MCYAPSLGSGEENLPFCLKKQNALWWSCLLNKNGGQKSPTGPALSSLDPSQYLSKWFPPPFRAACPCWLQKRNLTTQANSQLCSIIPSFMLDLILRFPIKLISGINSEGILKGIAQERKVAQILQASLESLLFKDEGKNYSAVWGREASSFLNDTSLKGKRNFSVMSFTA